MTGGRPAPVVKIRALMEKGTSLRRIARVLGCPYSTVNKVANRERALENARKPVVDPTQKRRICLSCREAFMSEGKHNHVCKKCKEGASWRGSGSDFSLAGLG